MQHGAFGLETPKTKVSSEAWTPHLEEILADAWAKTGGALGALVSMGPPSYGGASDSAQGSHYGLCEGPVMALFKFGPFSSRTTVDDINPALP